MQSLALVLLLLFCLAPFLAYSRRQTMDEENRTLLQSSQNVSRNFFGPKGEKAAATCYDSRIASYINTGLSYYSHNMGQLANYILNQIKVARYSGYWLVHAEIVAGQQQGFQWQSAATGDIFAPSSRHGCYYHDTQTYIIVLQY